LLGDLLLLCPERLNEFILDLLLGLAHCLFSTAFWSSSFSFFRVVTFSSLFFVSGDLRSYFDVLEGVRDAFCEQDESARVGDEPEPIQPA